MTLTGSPTDPDDVERWYVERLVPQRVAADQTFLCRPDGQGDAGTSWRDDGPLSRHRATTGTPAGAADERIASGVEALAGREVEVEVVAEAAQHTVADHRSVGQVLPGMRDSSG